MSQDGDGEFLTYLGVDRRVFTSTQIQELNALVFYKRLKISPLIYSEYSAMIMSYNKSKVHYGLLILGAGN